ncbi:TetR/AcrR family transcriptional regulator [Actinophytocola algeriensis]|uniref:AcrR family transcriptional regulator n=1 Tax=Actinophytocola algeriensis TaxID=1768010 RepID=A0A7W7Q1N6_9PSEU|nr:TetR/AcrR family transcriptional regulator [Actinophytocola algeriensis]MBB4905316.1 AcrR family transcriptional regulator [Actinophytocola algeriensis]MBE1472999.1 AcrR family transcriptional regulator [Actinophytocola algeriensis]
MGNREDLLAGALECLKEKGWARTTVRDIAAAAGVNHAAIGYHFGSREALLTAAFVQAMDEWGGEMAGAVLASLDPDATPRERYEAFWRKAIESYGAHRRLWLASVEAAVEAEHNPKVRELMVAALREGRSGLAAGLVGVPESELDEKDVRSIGSLQLALMSGVLVQWILDPENAPTAENLTDALLSLSGRLTS